MAEEDGAPGGKGAPGLGTARGRADDARKGVFALGTTLPVLGLTALLAAGIGATEGYVRRATRLDRWQRPIAGMMLVLAGLNDTLVSGLL